MGTPHLIFIYYKGKIHVAQYGQWDGHPAGQGMVILKFLKTPGNISRLKAAIDRGVLYAPSAEQLKQWQDEVNKVSEDARRHLKEENHDDETTERLYDVIYRGVFHVQPSISRDTGAKLLEMITAATMEATVAVELDEAFVTNGLLCEWVCVLDLDRDDLEIYKGASSDSYNSTNGPMNLLLES